MINNRTVSPKSPIFIFNKLNKNEFMLQNYERFWRLDENIFPNEKIKLEFPDTTSKSTQKHMSESNMEYENNTFSWDK